MILLGIGRRLKEAREKAGYTQEELGRMIGVTGSAITNYEKETSHPKEQILYALFGALNVEPNFLFQDCVDSLKAKKITPMGQRPKGERTVSESEYRIVEAYRVASEADRGIIDNIVDRYAPAQSGEEAG